MHFQPAALQTFQLHPWHTVSASGSPAFFSDRCGRQLPEHDHWIRRVSAPHKLFALLQESLIFLIHHPG
jgi:hypothetical protein